MKPLIFLLFVFFIVLQSFCVHHPDKIGKEAEHKITKFNSTLDSLQGTWHDEADLESKITINGNTWDEYYQTKPHIPYTIYFTDTKVTEDDFSNVSLNTSATSGVYLVKVRNSSNTVWCFELNGVYDSGTATTFSMTSTEVPFARKVFVKE
jgi:hypothetical protein